MPRRVEAVGVCVVRVSQIQFGGLRVHPLYESGHGGTAVFGERVGGIVG